MNLLLLVLFVLSLAGNGVLVYVLIRFARRLLQFDDLFGLLVNDMDVNAQYLEKLSNTPLLENSPEIVKAHNNMKIMGQRLEEFMIRVEETTGHKMRKKVVSHNPPVVI